MKRETPTVKIVREVCPAVITIVVSRDLPKIEGFYTFPLKKGNFVLPKFNNGKKEKVKIGGGSGFIISKTGLIITSRHVVADTEAEYTVIVEPKEKYPAKVLARDSINDVAILKVNPKRSLPFLKMGCSRNIEIGEEVIAVGNALGEFQDTVSSGIVSGLSRFIQADDHLNENTARLRGLIQTDAAINPGNSGGPLINMEGNVIGINTATIMGAQNIGFAIPIDYAKKDLEEVKKYGRIKRPFLGIKYIILNKKIAEKNHLPVDYGALIVRENLGVSPVVKGSAAEKAGLKDFDIILEAKGQKVSTKNPLDNILQKCQIEEEINLKILREGKEKTIKVKLEEKK
jgi:serine protease Do